MNESTTNMRTEEAIKEKIKESRFESWCAPRQVDN